MQIRTSRLIAAGAGAAAALGVSGVGASSAGAATVTFEGSCYFTSVQIRLNDGIGIEPGPFSGTMAGPGTCKGTIAGRRIDDRVSTLDLQMAGYGSCQSPATYAGKGTFSVDGVDIPVTAKLVRPGLSVMVTFELRGTVSGIAAGNGTGDAYGALSPSDPSHGPLGCGDGNLRATAVDVPFATSSPLVSTVADPPVQAVQPLRLAASDQRVATVRRTGVVRSRCTVPKAGRCTVTVRRGGRTVARGSANGTPGRSTAVRARLTKAGRRVLKGDGPIRVTVRATTPGSAARSRRIVLR